MKGTVYSAMSANQEVRLFYIDATAMVEAARKIHGTSPVATAAMGRTLAAASLLGRLSKNKKDRVTLRIKGDGPIGEIIAVSDAAGNTKITIAHPQTETTLTPSGKLDVARAVGRGEIYLIRDYGLKEPYVGRAPLVSGEIAEDLAHLFATSEQQPSIVNLGVRVDREGAVTHAGGLLVQPLPFVGEETLGVLEADAAAMAPMTALMAGGSGAQVIEAALPGLPLGLVLENEVALQCDCSRERMEKALLSLGEEDLGEMIDEGQPIELTCHFCHAAYTFDIAVLEKRLAEVQG